MAVNIQKDELINVNQINSCYCKTMKLTNHKRKRKKKRRRKGKEGGKKRGKEGNQPRVDHKL